MAWIETKQRRDGASYKVYWRDVSGRVRTKTFRLKKQAVAFKRDVEYKLQRGSYTDPAEGSVTLADFWVHYWRTAQPPAPATQALYGRLARQYILPRLGPVRLRELTKARVRTFLAELSEAGVPESTAEHTFRVLRRVLSVAVDEGRLAANPATGIRPPKPQPREMRILTPAEVLSIAEEVPARYRALVLFLALTGVRIGEATALKVKNVDLKNRVVKIVEAAAEVNGARLVGPTKTGKKRSVTMTTSLAREVSNHMARFGAPLDRESLVFTTEDGSPILRTNFRSRVLAPAAKRAGIEPSPRTHDLRHTAVALAIQAGVHPKAIQEMVGHSSITTTLDVYGHLFPTVQSEAAAKLEEIFAWETMSPT